MVFFFMLLFFVHTLIEDKYLKYFKCFYKDTDTPKILFAKLQIYFTTKKALLDAFIVNASNNNEVDLGFKATIKREINLPDSDIQNLTNSTGVVKIFFQQESRMIHTLKCTYTFSDKKTFICFYEDNCVHLDKISFLNYQNQANRLNTLLISSIVLSLLLVLMLVISLLKVFFCCCWSLVLSRSFVIAASKPSN